MIVTATVQAVAAQAQNRDEDIPAHEEKLDSERPTYLNLLKDNASPASAPMAPPLFFVQKKFVAPGPGLEPVEVLEAVSPRCQSGLPLLIRALPYAQRKNQGAKTQQKPRLRPRPLTEATLASVPKQSGYDAMRDWLAGMELATHTEYAALAVAEAQCEAISSMSSSSISGCSTVGGDGGTFAHAFGLGILARCVARHIRRRPVQFVKGAVGPLVQAFKSQTVLDAAEWPVSHALTKIEEWEHR